ncbi:MAG: hypothetical protein IT279_00355 [Ignavibacteriaceae bacterium]|nr:hypothetical protein [Ignavibacteriaceae bacterium]
MQQFKDYLEEEGLPADGDSEEITIDIIPTLADLRSKNLKYIHVKAGSDFKKAVKVDVVLSEVVRNITLNWYAKVQVLKSGRAVPLSEITSIETGKLLKEHLAFLDWTDLYFSLQNFKNERSWYNLNLSMTELKRILENPDWYVLEIPSAELEVSDFSQVKVWQEIALSLLKSYTERLYNYQKNLYYGSKFEVSILDSTHPNFEIEYRLLIKKSEEQLISRLRELKGKIKANQFSENIRLDANFEFLYNQVHLYQPLVYLGKEGYQEVLKIQPVALNKGERGFVEDLKTFYNKTTGFFTERQVYLLRNLSKRGIGFFEANHFYPDFILWIVSGEKQYVSFVDPKGLRQVQGFMNPKIQLHKKIKSDVQPQLSDKEIELNSFIISPTLYEEVSYWSGRNSIEDFNNHNIFFQHDQRNYYIQMMLEKIVEEIAE